MSPEFDDITKERKGERLLHFHVDHAKKCYSLIDYIMKDMLIISMIDLDNHNDILRKEKDELVGHAAVLVRNLREQHSRHSWKISERARILRKHYIISSNKRVYDWHLCFVADFQAPNV